ncbi:MAG TPA: hypothetical protein VLX92_01930 [Kofleriaceae bacterium]|nr:hypothetical protein [Kofleriaceae bacterium]
MRWLCLVLVACSTNHAAPDASSTGGDDAPPIDAAADAGSGGMVTNVAYNATCTMGTPQGGSYRCAVLTVSCPGTDDIQVDVALTPGSADKGVISTHSGTDGMTFLTTPVVTGMIKAGWSLAQIAWHSPWECPHTCGTDTTPPATRSGIVEAACRPATVMRWIHDQAQAEDGSPFLPAGKPYCGHGSSGGSGAFWYALTRYQLGDLLDYVVLQASTPFGRIDVGCDPTTKATLVPAPCDNLATAPPQVFVNFTDGGTNTASVFNTWLSTSSCDVAPSADEMALYARSSIVGPGADFEFATPVTTYDCIDQVDKMAINVVPGAGHYVHDALRANDPTGAKWSGVCVVKGTNGTCTDEEAFEDTPTAQAAVSDFEARCVPLVR